MQEKQQEISHFQFRIFTAELVYLDPDFPENETKA